MKVGSLVIAIENFDEVRQIWGFNYPHLHDILTISFIEPYTFGAMAGSKYVMLYFEELVLPFGICSRAFREIQPPMNLSKLMDEVNELQLTNTLKMLS